MRQAVLPQAFWKGCGIVLAAFLLVIGIPLQQATATSPNQPVPYIEAIGPVAVAPGATTSPQQISARRRQSATHSTV